MGVKRDAVKYSYSQTYPCFLSFVIRTVFYLFFSIRLFTVPLKCWEIQSCVCVCVCVCVSHIRFSFFAQVYMVPSYVPY